MNSRPSQQLLLLHVKISRKYLKKKTKQKKHFFELFRSLWLTAEEGNYDRYDTSRMLTNYFISRNDSEHSFHVILLYFIYFLPTSLPDKKLFNLRFSIIQIEEYKLLYLQ